MGDDLNRAWGLPRERGPESQKSKFLLGTTEYGPLRNCGTWGEHMSQSCPSEVEGLGSLAEGGLL